MCTWMADNFKWKRTSSLQLAVEHGGTLQWAGATVFVSRPCVSVALTAIAKTKPALQMRVAYSLL